MVFNVISYSSAYFEALKVQQYLKKIYFLFFSLIYYSFTMHHCM